MFFWMLWYRGVWRRWPSTILRPSMVFQVLTPLRGAGSAHVALLLSPESISKSQKYSGTYFHVFLNLVVNWCVKKVALFSTKAFHGTPGPHTNFWSRLCLNCTMQEPLIKFLAPKKSQENVCMLIWLLWWRCVWRRRTYSSLRPSMVPQVLSPLCQVGCASSAISMRLLLSF